MKNFIAASAFLFASVACVAAQADQVSVPASGTSVSVLTGKAVEPPSKKEEIPAVPETVPASQNNGYVRPTKQERAKRYFDSMFGWESLGKRVVTSGYGTWRNSPEEWEPTWAGFGRRFASSTGKSVIKNTIQYGLEEAFKLDSKFYRSTKKDFGSRLGNA